MKDESQIILYQTEDGKTKVQVKMDGDTVWLSQKQMGELFDCSIDNVALHLKNIFRSAELSEKSVAEDFSVTANGRAHKTVFCDCPKQDALRGARPYCG